MNKTLKEWEAMVNSGCSLRDYITSGCIQKMEISDAPFSSRLVCPVTGETKTNNQAAREGWVVVINRNYIPSAIRIHPDALSKQDVILNIKKRYP